MDDLLLRWYPPVLVLAGALAFGGTLSLVLIDDLSVWARAALAAPAFFAAGAAVGTGLFWWMRNRRLVR